MLHYEKASKRIQIEPSTTLYKDYWDIPVPEYQ